MATPLPPAPERPIDRALSLVAGGDAAGALRYTLPLLEGEPEAALPLFVTGRALSELGETESARLALSASARSALRASNLPLSLAAAASLSGAERGALLGEISRAFGKGSSALGERRPAPPELPGARDDFEPLADELAQPELVEQAGRVLAKAYSDGEVSLEPGSLSPQPLFSSLEPEALAEFASIFEVRTLPAGKVVFEEGTSGSEALVVARGELDVEKRTGRAAAPLRLARLGAGALVGEMALLSRAPRAATVTVFHPSIVLVGKKEDLDRVAAGAPAIAQRFAEHCKRRMIDNLLRTSALLRDATAAERPSLVERFAIRTFEAGEKLATQGQPSEGLHLIASGDVSVVHREGDDKTLVTRLGPGDVVGEVALVFRRSAITDAVAQHPTVTLFLPRARFLDLVRAHPKVFADLYEIAVRRDEEILTMSAEEATEGEDFVFV
jgi:cAMP-dependent protein kinase regulator